MLTPTMVASRDSVNRNFWRKVAEEAMAVGDIRSLANAREQILKAKRGPTGADHAMRSFLSSLIGEIFDAIDRLNDAQATSTIMNIEQSLTDARNNANVHMVSEARRALERVVSILRGLASESTPPYLVNALGRVSKLTFADLLEKYREKAKLISVEIDELEMETGKAHVTFANGYYTRFWSYVTTENAGGAEKTLQEMHTHQDVRCGLAALLKSVQARDEFLITALTEVTRLYQLRAQRKKNKKRK